MTARLVDNDHLRLRLAAVDARRHVIEAVATARAGHIGGPLSVIDILTVLYGRVLHIDPKNPNWTDRDRFILSKGHASIGLYAVLAVRGLIDVSELKTFDALDSRLQGHPDMAVLPWLDMSTGSLGQGLSPGLGMALGARLLGRSFHTFVVLGDGELQEGQVWEAAMVASRYALDDLIVIVDRNGLQQWGWAGEGGYGVGSRASPVEDCREKWAAFGWNVLEIDGHDLEQIADACDQAVNSTGRPSVVIAETVKGRGVSFMEGDPSWHARVPNEDELALAIEELAAARQEIERSAVVRPADVAP